MNNNRIPRILRTQIAGVTPFDNSENGFVAEEVQSAVEENKASSSAGWTAVGLNIKYKVLPDRIAITSKFEKQSGFIRHSGFIKGNA